MKAPGAATLLLCTRIACGVLRSANYFLQARKLSDREERGQQRKQFAGSNFALVERAVRTFQILNFTLCVRGDCLFKQFLQYFFIAMSGLKDIHDYRRKEHFHSVTAQLDASICFNLHLSPETDFLLSQMEIVALNI